jgi:S1-C subfamily serine protease
LWLITALLFLLSMLITPRGIADEPARALDGASLDLEAQQRAFQQVIEQVAPSVVGIRAQRLQITSSSNGVDRGEPTAQYLLVNGAGTVLTADGLILTSEHVVQAATDIEIVFYDGQRARADVLAADPRSDLAVLQTGRPGLRPAAPCNWEDVARGQWIVVLGNPFGLGRDGQLCASVGVIANLGRELPGLGETDDRFYHDMIQFTAPIHPGNSGGPLFNIRGELVGVIAAMHTRAPADDGVGFAVPLTPVKRRLIETLAAGRSIEYGYLGVTARQPDADERAALGVGYGVVIQRVEPSGPAAQAGVAVDDVILNYDGQPVTGPAQFAELVGQSPVGATVELAVSRDGRHVTLRAVLERRDAIRANWMRDVGTRAGS